jgi:2-phosphoglycolate phosphatase
MKDIPAKGVIFDLDGTLIDSYQALFLAFRHTYENMGLAPLSAEEVRRVLGHGVASTFQDLLGEERVPEAMKLFRQEYEEVMRPHTQLLPGAREVIETLHGRGIQVAIATNKLGYFARELSEYYGLDKLIAVIVGDGDVSQNKPDPEMLLHAIEKMRLKKEEVIFVGDSPIDIQTGKNAGVRVFAVPTGGTQREDLEKAQPTLILDRLLDLLYTASLFLAHDGPKSSL